MEKERYFVQDTYTKAQNALELAKLIKNLKYKEHKLAIKFLREYDDTDISSDWKYGNKGSLHEIADQIEARFSTQNKIRNFLRSFFVWL